MRSLMTTPEQPASSSSALPDREWLNVEEVAAALGVGTQRVYEMVKDQTLEGKRNPIYKKRIIIRRASVLPLLEYRLPEDGYTDLQK